ncbi:hypothetical protein N0V93_000948 [Gnomoniopsis smithogilvyi]|uniref:SGNH hydrolase-type esterase domain-containing protein n=1 Tax=Gnomoniopsis smithogilvyi TaxID=1191159 RepID=A0A9W8Z0T1_9PEZI|nr:hypothetical protein N0V93_000948 [Gnomoniopsis smithogilvyi]
MATPPNTNSALPSPRASPSSAPSSPHILKRASNNSSKHITAISTAASPKSRPKPKHTLRILCFGDSLTSGYSSSPDHPYSHHLTTTLTRAFPSLTIDAHTDGVPGDTVSLPGSRYLRRIEPPFLSRGGGTPFDWTVILGGTNDLALGVDAERIFESLRKVWAVPLSKGGRVLACTVPDAGTKRQQDVDAREELNGLIRSHRQENFHVFDLAAAIPYHTMQSAERERYWDDHIHLMPAGYDLMGEKIAARLVELIMPPGRLQAKAERERPPRRKRVFRDDDRSFEEESGDDSVLGQGYYVVRWKDLE